MRFTTLTLLCLLATTACRDVSAPLVAPGDALLSQSGDKDPVRYELTDLGTLGGNASFALGINNNGVVVGTARTTTAFRPQIAFAWKRGEITNLGTLSGSTFSRAFQINERGIAVGEGFTAPPERSRAVLWRNGQIVDLGALGTATGAVANGINNDGTVVGVSGGRAVVWSSSGRIRDLGTISNDAAATSRGTRINDRGQAVGSSQTDIRNEFGSRVSHAFLWTHGRMIDLGSLGDDDHFSVALGINNRGEVVGESVAGHSASGSDIFHAFVWERGVMRDLGTLGMTHSRASDINARGQIVGHAGPVFNFPTLGAIAVLWEDGRAIDLNTAIAPGSGWVLRSAEGINARGQIVGYGTLNGETRAYLLTPRGGDRDDDED